MYTAGRGKTRPKYWFHRSNEPSGQRACQRRKKEKKIASSNGFYFNILRLLLPPHSAGIAATVDYESLSPDRIALQEISTNGSQTPRHPIDRARNDGMWVNGVLVVLYEIVFPCYLCKYYHTIIKLRSATTPSNSSIDRARKDSV